MQTFTPITVITLRTQEQLDGGQWVQGKCVLDRTDWKDLHLVLFNNGENMWALRCRSTDLEASPSLW